MVFTQRWSLYTGNIKRVVIKYTLAIFGIELLCGLCTEVVFRRWSLIKGFTLRFICIKFWPFPFSISIFCFRFPFPLFSIALSEEMMPAEWCTQLATGTLIYKLCFLSKWFCNYQTFLQKMVENMCASSAIFPSAEFAMVLLYIRQISLLEICDAPLSCYSPLKGQTKRYHHSNLVMMCQYFHQCFTTTHKWLIQIWIAVWCFYPMLHWKKKSSEIHWFSIMISSDSVLSGLCRVCDSVKLCKWYFPF